jgi:carbon monoxide dehydrogenase subunit G
MDITGEQIIPLPQQRVWEALNDPAILKACIPGCETMEKVSDSEYRVVMSASVGPVKAKFSGKLLLSDLNPPNSYALAFEGSGGAAGFGKGSSTVTLSPADGGTRLTYTAHATVGGKLAQVGSRLIDGVARKMADDFFAKFNQAIVPAPAAVAAVPAPSSAPQKAHIPVWAWVVGVIVLVLLALFLAKGTAGH